MRRIWLVPDMAAGRGTGSGATVFPAAVERRRFLKSDQIEGVRGRVGNQARQTLGMPDMEREAIIICGWPSGAATDQSTEFGYASLAARRLEWVIKRRRCVDERRFSISTQLGW